MLKGTLETAQNPMGAALGEVQNAIDSPSAAYYLGEKGADAAFAPPALMFGGEGAAVEAGLPAEVVTEGGAPLAVVHGWDPLGANVMGRLCVPFWHPRNARLAWK